MTPALRTIGALALLALFVPTLDAREPSDLEQYFLELINRARANPPAEVTRLAGSPDWEGTPGLNEGLPADTITAAAKQPLTFDPRIINAASDYTDLLLANQASGHNYGGTNPQARMEAKGYDFVPTYGWGENIALTAKYPSNPLNAAAVEEHHDGLFIDDDVAGRGHRKNILNPDFREVGIAIRGDSNGLSYFGSPYIDIQSTQDFAFSQNRIFVTGIVYQDNDGNSFFTPNNGEGLGGLTVEIRGPGGVIASATTFATGGYSINLAGQSAQTLEFRIINGSGAVFSKNFSWNGGANVKVDARDPAFGPPGEVPDTTAPSITYQRPKNRAKLGRRSTHRGTASDDRAVAKVTYKAAGDRLRTATFNAANGKWSFRVNLNSPKLRKKKNIRITVFATDASGNSKQVRRRFKRR